MIAKCSQIPHGATAMNYNTTKDKVELIGFHGLPEDSTPDNFWSRMMAFQIKKRQEIRAWKPLTHTALRFEVSPVNENTENWSLDDWHRLAIKFINEVDKIVQRPPKKDRKPCALKPTNLANSQYVVVLHHDSKSGIRHLHILVNRVDMNGYTNDAHYIGERAVEAANRITQRMGWKLASDCRADNIEKIHCDAIDVLRSMDSFSWDEFTRHMESKDYELKLRRDNNQVVRGMSVKMGYSVYMSSELGHGRDLMPSKIESTWRNLHKASQQTISTPVAKVTEPKPTAPVVKPVVAEQPKITEKSQSGNGKVKYPVAYGDKTYISEIDRSALEHLEPVVKAEMLAQNEETGMEVLNAAKVTMLLFGMYVDAATSMSESMGGGGSPGSGWGRRDDEDDLKWLRRCARQAVWMCKSMGRSVKR